ncbi:carbohydrate ABC transporter permease [Desertihabitans brevis]|uniref:Carbohydrate ABC transporter permease n=1 Tax=Desertihabitans brevis TaxID=2268447 RepID=A0A367YXT4_9ACTN|nr:carbohydrate ABC transporter permease [Desertihabitans brevis]RCK70638.1 carbohydrate ABC transporter permease [Desertihabitans brevis]
MTTIAAPASGRRVITDVATASAGRRRGPSLGRGFAFLVLLVMAVAWLVPFVWALLTSFKTETEAASAPVTFWPTSGFSVEGYVATIANGQIPLWIGNSLLTSTIITVLSVGLAAAAGYAFSRIEFAGKKVLFAVIIGSIIVPPQILLVPLFQEMLVLGLVDTYAAIILPQLIHPEMVFILKKFFDAVPVELEQAALVDGANRLRVFWTIVLPLSRPILAAVSIFIFIGAWNNFLWPFIAVSDTSLMTLPVGLETVKSAYGIQYAQNMASAMLAAAPLILVFLFFQRQIIRGVATTGFGGQ